VAHLESDHRLVARHLIGGRVPGDGWLQAAVLQTLGGGAGASRVRLDGSSQSVHADGLSELENTGSAVRTRQPLSKTAQA